MIVPIKVGSQSTSSLYTSEPSDEYINMEDLEFILGDSSIEQITYQFFTHTIEDSCCTIGEETRIVGFDQNTDFILKPWLEQNGLNKLNTNQVIIGKDINYILGQKMSILKKEFNIVGTLYETGSGLDNTIFMDIESARILAKSNFKNSLFDSGKANNLISSAFIKVKSGVNIDDFITNINISQNKVIAISKSASITQIKSQIQGILYIAIFLVLSLLISSVISLFGRFSNLAEDRKKEIGYLRIIGVKRNGILKLITYEACIMSIIGGITGSILSLLFIPIFIKNLEDYFTLPIGSMSHQEYIFIGIFISIILGLFSCLIPAIKITKLEPREIISKGDI